MIYLTFKLIHIFSVFIYGGFLFTDNLILIRMQKNLSKSRYAEVRSYFAKYTRELVPKALIMAVISGIYLIYMNFGIVSKDGFSDFQILLSLKAFLGLWLGLRGVLQVFFGVQPLVFKSHLFPFLIVVVIISISQIMYNI